jgi:hypothetical protein
MTAQELKDEHPLGPRGLPLSGDDMDAREFAYRFGERSRMALSRHTGS